MDMDMDLPESANPQLLSVVTASEWTSRLFRRWGDRTVRTLVLVSVMGKWRWLVKVL